MTRSGDASIDGSAKPDRSWAVVDDVATSGLLVRMPRYISTEIAAAATAEVVRRLVEGGQPTVVVLDLHDVEDQDIMTPLVVMKNVLGVVGLIARVDLIVSSHAIRVAALTATQILGLSCTVRSER